MTGAPATRVLVHADESCLGNGTEPPNPGGNAALVEAPAGDSVARWDLYECSPDTTNQKMALAGAIATLEWLHRQWKRARVVYVSDSEYLIKGMTAWPRTRTLSTSCRTERPCRRSTGSPCTRCTCAWPRSWPSAPPACGSRWGRW